MAEFPTYDAPIADRESFWNQVAQTGRTFVKGFDPNAYGGKTGKEQGQVDREHASTEALNRAIASRNLAGIGLEKSIPEIGQAFETTRTGLKNEMDPLKERYQNLIDEVKGYGEKAVKNVGTNLSRELGRRGILTTSGLGERTITEGVNPIYAEYASKVKDVGFERETKLREISNQIAQLTDQEVAAKRSVQNAIAQLRVAGSEADANRALSNVQSYTAALAQASQFKDTLSLEYAKLQNNLDQQELINAGKDKDSSSGSGSSSGSSTSTPPNFIPDFLKSTTSDWQADTGSSNMGYLEAIKANQASSPTSISSMLGRLTPNLNLGGINSQVKQNYSGTGSSGY